MRFYFPITKIDAEQRTVWGYASTEALDDQGEIVTREALAAALEEYMRFANIREMHQPSAVGVATAATVDDKGLYVAAKIIDESAWAKVQEGVYKGFSIGGRVKQRDRLDHKVITGLALTEISVVDRPANPEAVFDCWKAEGGDLAMPADGFRGATDYADPGYQPDGRKRYPLDSETHIRAAWAYIHKPANAARYTANQLNRIKAHIVTAWKERIDRAGPPSAEGKAARAVSLRKSLRAVGCLARIILDLEWLQEVLAIEAAMEENDSSTPPRLLALIAELCGLLNALVAEETRELVDGTGMPDIPAPAGAVLLAAGASGGAVASILRTTGNPRLPPFAAAVAQRDAQPSDLADRAANNHEEKAAGAERVGEAARSDALAKALADNAALRERLDAVVPRVDQLARRVEELAQTPLPPLTLARGATAVAKREDGGAASANDVIAAPAGMSGEERTIALIKAAYANPIAPPGQAPAGTRGNSSR
jgi:HK97 family phage prohead protease